jgi:hypothetical protein
VAVSVACCRIISSIPFFISFAVGSALSNVWAIPTLERLAKTACLPASQKIELFSGNAPQENWGFGLFLVLADTFSLVAPMDASFFVLE